MHRRHPLCVKEEKGAERKWEREGIRPHTPIFAEIQVVIPQKGGIIKFFCETIKV